MMLIYSDHARRRARQRRAPVFTDLPDGREPAAVVGDDPAQARQIHLLERGGKTWMLVVSCRLRPVEGGWAAVVVTVADLRTERQWQQSKRRTPRGRLAPLLGEREAMREAEALSLAEWSSAMADDAAWDDGADTV